MFKILSRRLERRQCVIQHESSRVIQEMGNAELFALKANCRQRHSCLEYLPSGSKLRECDDCFRSDEEATSRIKFCWRRVTLRERTVQGVNSTENQNGKQTIGQQWTHKEVHRSTLLMYIGRVTR